MTKFITVTSTVPYNRNAGQVLFFMDLINITNVKLQENMNIKMTTSNVHKTKLEKSTDH